MTIAISIKVDDGVVLAADSAATIFGRSPAGEGVIKVYNNANKIFNLRKRCPIGAIAWGSGSIGQASISTLAKDFRKSISDKASSIFVDPAKYTIEEVAKKFAKYIYNDRYQQEFKDWTNKPVMGFMIVGYSTDKHLAEEWKIEIENGECKGPFQVRQQHETGVTWNGEPEAICRLYLGFGIGLPVVLAESGYPQDKIPQLMNLIKERLSVPMVFPPMPIKDAIDLGAFLVDTTIKFSQFKPGAQTVGGPIEVAVITKHEGFKWVQRKHYFDTELNPNLEV